MLTHHRRPVCLSLVSTDMPVWSTIETAATLYQKDKQRFHLLLTEPEIRDWERSDEAPAGATDQPPATPRLLWLEISPSRVIMTMQGNGKLSYRHLWERGIYGLSRYWLHSESLAAHGQVRLRNFTKSLTLEGRLLPEHLRLEYELWSEKVQLGSYILNLEIHH
ncbi:MAG: hypothetical protein AB1861_06235 [Cyanobacteriota bacterium]